MNTLKPRIASLLQQLNERVFEKEHIVALALLSAVAGESIFLLGPPGVAKSMVGRRLKLAFRNASAFEYLMSRFSTPDEIFGPVSISKLKDEDTYERIVDGYLPSATIASWTRYGKPDRPFRMHCSPLSMKKYTVTDSFPSVFL